MKQKRVYFANLPRELTSGVEYVKDQLGLKLHSQGTWIHTESKKDFYGFEMKKEPDAVTIVYGTKSDFFRALSYLPGFLRKGGVIREERQNGLLSYMADQSRNAVYNMETAKQMLRYLALMGYNSMMLYTEDTFTVEGYSYFGRMRGRYSKAELKELDDYADALGIELIPCIQTLAHLNLALRWPDFNGYKDTGDILMVGDERTYRFIAAMLDTCKECFRSPRINVGMDEAHMLARGDYLLRNGYRKSSDVMLEHLSRVVELCTEKGYHAMMWSDMFFRMAFGGTYRVRSGEIAQEIIDRVPENLTLIYWDYYSLDREIFTHMVDCHLKFKNPVAFAGGAWKWSGFAPHNRFSLRSTEMQMTVAAEKGLNDVIVTAWGDNGGECSQFSVLPSMLYFAERVYRGTNVDDAQMEARSNMLFGIGYRQLLLLDLPNEMPGVTFENCKHPINPSRYLLFNDPLEGLFDLHMDPKKTPEAFKKAAEKLKTMSGHETFGYMFETLSKLCDLLSMKSDLSVRLRNAYLAGNKKQLSEVADQIPVIIAKLDLFIEAFRKQWYRENRTFGFSTQEIRLGGLRSRLSSTHLRVRSYLAGEVEDIPELEQEVLSNNGKSKEELENFPYIGLMIWNANANAGIL